MWSYFGGLVRLRNMELVRRTGECYKCGVSTWDWRGLEMWSYFGGLVRVRNMELVRRADAG